MKTVSFKMFGFKQICLKKREVQNSILNKHRKKKQYLELEELNLAILQQKHLDLRLKAGM